MNRKVNDVKAILIKSCQIAQKIILIISLQLLALNSKQTIMTLFDVYPLNDITITKAQGSYVWDDNGVQYLDMYGGHAVISIGHTHPHWVKRIEEQLEKNCFLLQLGSHSHSATIG